MAWTSPYESCRSIVLQKVGTTLKEDKMLVQGDVDVRALVLVGQLVPQHESVLVKHLNGIATMDSLAPENFM